MCPEKISTDKRRMYCGFDKDGGSTIGDLSQAVNFVNFEDVQDSSAAEETLVCQDDMEKDCILVSLIDPSSGELGWQKLEDFNDENNLKVVKMSQMTSMLRDYDRNSVFEGAIAKLIKNFRDKMGRPPIVLDVGTGTGLLSLLCMRHGAQYVFTAEMFAPLAAIAQEVIFSNKESDSIMIIQGKSTDIDGDSLPIRPDLIVSELLDSALIGESVITSHADAINRLLAQDIDEDLLPMKDRILPNSGLVFATLIESEEVAQLRRVPVWHPSLSPWRAGQPEQCNGMQPLIPVQWDQFERRNGSKALSSSTSILTIEFFHGFSTDPLDLESTEEKFGFNEGTFETDIPIIADGTIHGLYLWWKTRMLSADLDGEEEFTYSTEPSAQNWQDHWQQTVYALPNPIACIAGDVVRVSAAHDCSRIWLSAQLQPRRVSKSVRDESSHCTHKKMKKVVADTINQQCSDDDCEFSHETLRNQAPVDFENRLQHQGCTCGWHILCNPDRLLMLNDSHRIELWTAALSRLLDGVASLESKASIDADAFNVVLDISDGSMLSLLAASKIKERSNEFPSLKIVSKERKQFSRMFHGQLAESNDLEDLLMLWNGESVEDIAEFFAPAEEHSADSEDSTGGGEDAEGDEQPQKQSLNCTVVALIGECFYYQLRSRPTWQALSFHYQRTAMQSIMHEKAIVMPHRALIMAAAFEIPQLHNSFGEVGSVSGFDHAPYDAAISGWHENMFHFKLGSYNKTLLTAPVVLTSLDYSQTVLPSRSSGTMPVTEPGQCHCVAIWVDYQLFEDSYDQQIRTWDDDEFVPYEKVSVQFFPVADTVEPGRHFIHFSCEFDVGESDFRFRFGIGP